jgi:hypothetical protein
VPISGTVWRQEGPPPFMGASPPEPGHGGPTPLYGCVRCLAGPTDGHKSHRPPRKNLLQSVHQFLISPPRCMAK